MPSQSRTVLYAWEWGAGVGHLARFSPLADDLVENGCRVSIAARDLTHARQFFCREKFELWQAPTPISDLPDRFSDPQTFGGFTWNFGYDSETRAAGWLAAWHSIVKYSNADLIVSDFGIAASSLASSMGIAQIRIGTGLECPPATNPLAQLKGKYRVTSREVEMQEEVLSNINRGLKGLRLPALKHLGEAIGSDGRKILATVPEFDPFERSATIEDYDGIWETDHPTVPVWPAKVELKAIAYLKPFPTLSFFFHALRAAGVGIVLVSDGISKTLLSSCNSNLVTVQSGFVNTQSAAEESVFAITNGNHGTTLRMLSLGVPVLAIPKHSEQKMTAARLEQLGLGRNVDFNHPEHFLLHIQAILNDPQYRRNAQAFAQKYSSKFEQSKRRVSKRLLEVAVQCRPPKLNQQD